jgi:hypothetical protein
MTKIMIHLRWQIPNTETEENLALCAVLKYIPERCYLFFQVIMYEIIS